jgi:hypothetical protein
MGEAARIEQQAYAVRLVAQSAKIDRTVNVLADSANEAIRDVLAGLTAEERRASDLDVKLRLGDAQVGALAAVELPGSEPANDNALDRRESIGGRDEAWLTKFFGNARAERSPAGAILDLAELYSYHEPVERPDYGEDPPAGIELLERLDAQPTKESREASREGPDDEALIVLGVVSRRLSVVRKVDPLSYTVLSAFYGDAGAVHARGDYGREAALVPYTKAGQRLARIGARKSRGSKRKATKEEHVQGEMTVAIARARSGLAQAGAGEEGALIARGLSEARDLLARAARAWNSTAPRRISAA